MGKESPFPEPEPWGPKGRNHSRGCDHTEDYADEKAGIVCVNGWMIDVDTYHEGYDRSDFKHPCPCCNKSLFIQWMAAEMWQQSVPDEEIRVWVAQKSGAPASRCPATPDLFTAPADQQPDNVDRTCPTCGGAADAANPPCRDCVP